MTYRVPAGGGHQQQPRVHVNRDASRMNAGRRVIVKSNNENNLFTLVIGGITALFCCLFCCRSRDEDSIYESSSDKGYWDRRKPAVVINSPQGTHVPVGMRNGKSYDVKRQPPSVILSNNQVSRENQGTRVPVNTRRNVSSVAANNQRHVQAAPVIRQQVGVSKDRRI